MDFPDDNKENVHLTYLVVGLGNPGRRYRANRHNIGFMVADAFAGRHGIEVVRKHLGSITGSGLVNNHRVIVAKPQTFMNLSGDSISRLARFYKLPPGQVVVIYDELDLPLGTIRIREQGGSGGHNGMRSLIRHLGQEFPRVRMGIGRPPGRMEPADFVLQDFNREEKDIVDQMINEAVDAVEVIVVENVNSAMNGFNGSVLIEE